MQISLFTPALPAKTETYHLLTAPDQSIYDHILTFKQVVLDCETFDPEPECNKLNEPIPRHRKGQKIALNPIEGAIRLVQIRAGETNYIFDLGERLNRKPQPEFTAFLTALLQEPDRRVLGHNLIFDLRFIRWQLGIETKCKIADTLLGAKVYFGDFGKGEGDKKHDPVIKGGYSLKNLCQKFLRINVDKTEQVSDWGLPLTESQLTYAALDVEYTEKLYNMMHVWYTDADVGSEKLRALYSPTLMAAWELENDTTVKAINTEVTGLPVDRDILLAQIDQVTEIYEAECKKWESKIGASYTKNEATKEWFANQGVTISSLNKEALTKLSGEHPVLNDLMRLRALKSYIDNLLSLEASSRRTGRALTILRHPTGCGRFSSGNTDVSKAFPNLQSIGSKLNPLLKQYKLPKIRTSVRAPKGRVFAVIDLAAAHARVAAGLANDQAAILGLNDDSIDNHSKVAHYIALSQGLDWSWEYIAKVRKQDTPEGNTATLFRNTAKNTYYGWLNGAGASKIRNQIAANTGHEPELSAVEAAVKGCAQIYPNIDRFKKEWLKAVGERRIEIDGQVYVILEPPKALGRRLIKAEVGKRFTNGEWQTIEHPRLTDYVAPYTKTLGETWQYTEAIAFKVGFLAAHELAESHPEWGLQICAVVHDEIDIECDEAYAEDAITAVNNAFNDAFLGFLSNGVLDGRDTDWKKLVADSWADK